MPKSTQRVYCVSSSSHPLPTVTTSNYIASSISEKKTNEGEHIYFHNDRTKSVVVAKWVFNFFQTLPKATLA